MPNFKPIVKTTISNEIVEQVLSMIHSKKFKPGDRLPSERELSRAFKVGRSSVREAMKILEATGLVKTTNRGMFVCELKDRTAFTLDAELTNIHEVFEARKIMEIELAALAARRATPKDMNKMSRSLIEPDKRHEAIAADIAFHRALAEAAHNSVFIEIYNLIAGLLFQTFKYYSHLEGVEDVPTYAKQIFRDHERIFQAVKSRDPAASKRAVRKHLDNAEIKLLTALEEGQESLVRPQSKRVN
ncbi:MAG: FadR/GntR family transcriptional regulator [Pseudomonadota bacterium]